MSPLSRPPQAETERVHRLRLTRAEGLHVWDREGRRYLDATSGAFCVQLGYSRPDLVQAMADAATRLPHARPSTSESEEGEAYRREILAAAGPPYSRVVLTSSGSEAVDAAMKIAHLYQLAMRHSTRSAVLYLRGHYHGATLGGLGVTGWRARRRPYEALVGPEQGGPAAYCRRCFRSLTHPSCRSACADAAISAPPTAMILETIPAAGLGAPVPPPGYLARVRTLCDGAGALWIADEVMTAFGRTGSLFAWKRLAERTSADGGAPDRGAKPDLVVFGKGAGCGYAALGGVLLADRVARAVGNSDGLHVQTHGGNPIAAAVGRRVLQALAEEGIESRVRAAEAALEESLRRLESLPSVYDVRGAGFLWGVELVEDRETGRPFPRAERVAERVADACRERGVLVHAGTGCADGERGDFILVAPPLIADEAAFAEIADYLAQAIEATG